MSTTDADVILEQLEKFPTQFWKTFQLNLGKFQALKAIPQSSTWGMHGNSFVENLPINSSAQIKLEAIWGLKLTEYGAQDNRSV